MIELTEKDPALVASLRELGGKYGPLGVALTAVQLTDPRVVVEQILKPKADPTDAEPGEHDDLRQRYAEALAGRLQADKVAVPESVTTTTSLTPGVYDLADAVLAVRDDELADLRERLHLVDSMRQQNLDAAAAAIERAERAEEECAALRTQLTAARMALQGAEREAEAVGRRGESALQRAEAERDEVRAVVERDITIDSWLYRRVERAEADALAVREALERFRKFLDRDFRHWCSPNGVAAEYAARLIGQLDRFEQTGDGNG